MWRTSSASPSTRAIARSRTRTRGEHTLPWIRSRRCVRQAALARVPRALSYGRNDAVCARRVMQFYAKIERESERLRRARGAATEAASSKGGFVTRWCARDVPLAIAKPSFLSQSLDWKRVCLHMNIL